MSEAVKKTDYYELLDIHPGAPPQEIKEACERALSTFEGDSAAIYSLYTPEERESIVSLVREAREVLLDPARRAAYDDALGKGREPEITAEFDADELRSPWPGSSAYANKVRFVAEPPQVANADSIITEQYRVLYTKLQHIASEGRLKVVAVTSSVKNEGKSVTSLNLAFVIAREFKKKVLLIECDLRKPSMLSSQIGREGAMGLSDVVSGKASANETVCRVEDTSLHLLTSGTSMKNPSEIIDSPRLKELLEKFRTEFDYVIIDTPPILPLMDMNILARLADGVILVVRAGRTPKKIVLNAVQSVSGARFIGAVLNGADGALSKYYY